MTDLRKAAEELIKEWDWECGEYQNKALAELIEALRQALAQSVDAVNMSQERVDETAKCKREWVGLTHEEAKQLVEDCDWYNFPVFFCFEVEAKLKEKNR